MEQSNPPRVQDDPEFSNRAKDDVKAPIDVNNWLPSSDRMVTAAGITFTAITAINSQSQTVTLITGVGAALITIAVRIPYVVEKIGEAWAKVRRLNAQAYDETYKAKYEESERRNIQCQQEMEKRDKHVLVLEKKIEFMEEKHHQDYQQLHDNWENLRKDNESLFKLLLIERGYLKPNGGTAPA